VKSPIIIEGKAFDWHEGAEYSAKAVDSDGNVNWQAASFADPGVIACPKCKAYLWNEGLRVRCPDCGEEFDTENKKFRERLRK
jgi:hypothetical protein